MKHFARLQACDDQGPIRTNTTVCLGKILVNLDKEKFVLLTRVKLFLGDKTKSSNIGVYTLN